MNVIIKNENLNVEISPLGAELQSIKTASDSHEYIWQGDDYSWKRSAPILFPIVGALNNDRYVHDKKSYKMTQHGFARDMEFEILEQSDTEVLFFITDSESTHKVFPFSFRLILGYSIEGNTLKVSYKVDNRQDSDISFQIGAHPGFNCPLEDNLSFNDYILNFNKNETSERRFKNATVMNGERGSFFRDDNRMKLTHDLFRDGAVIFDDLKSTSVTLQSDRGYRKIDMNFEGFPYFGVWSWPKSPSDYICLEPWYGIDSTQGDAPNWEKKEGLITLKSDESFDAYYTITIC